MVRRITNAEIDEKERMEQEQAAFTEKQNQPVVSRLASHIRSAFTLAVSAKSTIQNRMLMCLRQREGIYEADIQQMIKDQNGTNIYMMITDVKCRALESWLKDVMLPSGEKPYKVQPTPVPDIPPHLVQKAQQVFMMDYVSRVAEQANVDITQVSRGFINEDDLREAAEKFKDELLKQIKEQAAEDAEKIEQHIDDELVEGKWYEALEALIEDFATYPTAFMEGPIFRRRTVLEWRPIPNTQMSEIGITEKIVKEYDRVDPLDVYPSPGARTPQDGDLCIRKRYTRRDLDALRGVDGFDTNAINQVLQQYQNGYREFVAYDTEIADLHDRPNESTDPEGHIDGIKFFGSVNGFTLREWGMTLEQIPDPFREYPVIAYVVGSYVIGARLNPHPLGRRNIYSASFRHKNGSVWGKSVPETMRDVQNICNSSARAICNNAAMASGPQVWQLVDLIPPEANRTEMFPWKIWEYSSEKLKTGAQQPMGFFQPDLIVNELLSLYKYFFDQGSEVTGIPAYIYGNQNIGGAGATASGLSMLMNAAAKGLRNAASNIDKGVISRSVEEHWLIIMLTRPDLARGDCRIVARASDYLIQAEQNQMRIAEALTATNNPTDMAIMGIDGRAELLKANFRRLNIPTDKLVPRREDMIAAKVEQEVQNIIMKLSQALQVPPEQLIAVLQQPPPGSGGGRVPAKEPQELGPDGNPMAGKDVRLFNQ
jgi:polyhydroxyalkanoate synthesis regulator phasin